MNQPIELISFKTCPFVQRVVIVLLEKKLDFKLTFIDLQNKPEWFLAISPMGKVPVLRVANTNLFESAIINEYLEDIQPTHMLPSDPLQRALNRAWIEFSSSLIMSLVSLTRAIDQNEFAKHREEYQQKLFHLEKTINHKPYFTGNTFALIDAAFAPAFVRLQYLSELFPDQFKIADLMHSVPNVSGWIKALLARESVRNSIVPEFKELMKDNIKKRDSYLSKQLVIV